MIHVVESTTAAADPAVAPRLTTRLSWAAAILMAVGSALGLLRPGIYAETDAVRAMFRGYDLIIALVAVPVLVATLLRPPSPLGRLVSAGVLGFSVYIYAYYVFGLAFNALFLVHVAAFVATSVALVLTVRSLYPVAITWPLRPARTAAALLAFLGVSLGAMWASRSLAHAMGGGVPADASLLVGAPGLTHLGYAMDLAVLVPLYIAASVGIWRRRPWGYVAGGIALVAGTVTQFTYVSAMVFQAVAGIPGARAFDPYEPLIIAAYVVGGISLLGAIRAAGVPARAERNLGG